MNFRISSRIHLLIFLFFLSNTRVPSESLIFNFACFGVLRAGGHSRFRIARPGKQLYLPLFHSVKLFFARLCFELAKQKLFVFFLQELGFC